MSLGKKLLRGRVCLMKELDFLEPHNCGASPVSPQPGYDTKHPGTDKKQKGIMFIFQLLSRKAITFFENWRPRKVAPRTIRIKANSNFFLILLAPVAIFIRFLPKR